MVAMEDRFESLVDRSGEHHLWKGARNPARGTGRLKLGGRQITAHRFAWELAYGTLPASARVLPCPTEPACVRLDHLRVEGVTAGLRRRAPKGAGTMSNVRAGVWKLTVTAPRDGVGRSTRVHRTVRATTKREAAEALAALVTEVQAAGPVATEELYSLPVDEAIERFLTNHLHDDKGRADKTIREYQKLHAKWFSPVIGASFVRDVELATLDGVFGQMRRAGLSRSRMNQARSLYAPFFKWALHRGLTRRNPMANFELPTSRYIPSRRPPPEAEEMSLLLREAVTVVPDVAAVLALGAVTGMRRGELVGLRRSRVHWDDLQITVDVAIDGKKVKGTKTGTSRTVFIDTETMAMLASVCADQDHAAAVAGAALASDPFLFSLVIDASSPMPPEYLTKRVATLKGHLGVEDKKSETIAREDEALRLFRLGPMPRARGKRGPAPKGGLSYAEIGARLDRTERWAALAVAAALRREASRRRGWHFAFDGSVVALRKFTSSELLDCGFNISMVAQRQGHGAQVLTKHYAKLRNSADRRAAEHLGRLLHGASEEDRGTEALALPSNSRRTSFGL